jgi:DNA (cytosine-5)-methyltransferase 1
VFCIGVLGEHEPIKFPKPFDNCIRLKHLLEDKVDEKYYIDDEKCRKLLDSLKSKDIEKMNYLGNVHPSGKGMNGSVYNAESVAPTITTNKGEGSKVLVGRALTEVRTEEAKQQRREMRKNEGKDYCSRRGKDLVPRQDDYSNCITATVGREHMIITDDEPKIIEDFYANRDIRVYDDCPTLRADRQGLKVIQEGTLNNCQSGHVYNPEGVSVNLCANGGGMGAKTGLYNVNYRIRKLTPRECFRLMAFSDEDFDLARNRLIEQFYKGKDKANSQLYKIAGNSIVVSVLKEIFKLNFK